MQSSSVSDQISDYVMTSFEYCCPSYFPLPLSLSSYLSPIAIQRGVFLVADPAIPMDSPFYRSVVLLYSHRQCFAGPHALNTSNESRGVFINKQDPEQTTACVMSPHVCCGYGGSVRAEMAVSVVLHTNTSLYHPCERTKKLTIAERPVIVTEQDQAYIALHHLNQQQSTNPSAYDGQKVSVLKYFFG
jgi:putative AlgH/UPF0301 family transcriptional regulator